MANLIDKDALVAEIKRISCENPMDNSWYVDTEELLNFINTLEVKDPYEQCIQYPSVKDGIKAHAETYSFNIESLLFNQLTKEQQELWRKEIEQACISGGEAGVELARDSRYKENLEVKEVDLESLVRRVIELYLEAGEHYNSVIKEERKEYGGSDLVIKLLDGVIDAKELSIQYVLDKLKAQKGEEA